LELVAFVVVLGSVDGAQEQVLALFIDDVEDPIAGPAKVLFLDAAPCGMAWNVVQIASLQTAAAPVGRQ